MSCVLVTNGGSCTLLWRLSYRCTLPVHGAHSYWLRPVSAQPSCLQLWHRGSAPVSQAETTCLQNPCWGALWLPAPSYFLSPCQGFPSPYFQKTLCLGLWFQGPQLKVGSFSNSSISYSQLNSREITDTGTQVCLLSSALLHCHARVKWSWKNTGGGEHFEKKIRNLFICQSGSKHSICIRTRMQKNPGPVSSPFTSLWAVRKLNHEWDGCSTSG